MANMNFDFNKIQRSFFKTTLKDGRELVVKMPMKKTFEKITAAQEMDLEEMSVGHTRRNMRGSAVKQPE